MHSEKKSKISSHLTLENAFIGLTVILGIIVLINIFTAAAINKDIKESKSTAEERLKPAKIQLAVVKNSKCAECFDISTVVAHVKNSNVNVTKEDSFEYGSAQGKELIAMYGIEKVPFAVVRGEIGKINIEGLEKNQDALLFTQINPPFTDPKTGKIKGRVMLYHLKAPACDKCNNLTLLIEQIRAGGVKIVEEKIVYSGSSEGNQLASKYKVDFAPTIILSEDAGFYPLIAQAWEQVGNKENGSYVFRGGLAYPAHPFINLTTGKLVGIVDIIYLTDKSCAECYDAGEHKNVLSQSFGIKFGKEETIDAGDAKGKELIAKYNITKIPTVILSDEAKVYPSSEPLRQFFSVEKDGSYIFRVTEAIGAYRDLQKNEVVQPQQQ
ncbi:hypothetical protein HY487_01585 [Candidatus Woesearchaeota archaeon]|nr:hypothetical protein [Candidatus Woesearchaeota archaeon]